jgi:adenosylmethionine-8-amino-7-oxononanoate aminotransferase
LFKGGKMDPSKNKMDQDSHLILHLTPRTEIEKGITVMSKGLIIKLAPMKQAFEFAPPLIMQKDEIDAAVKILDECISEEEKDIRRTTRN